jgi:hypothetical protein
VDGARRGWSDAQLRSVMGRLVPHLGVAEPEVETEVEVVKA